MVKGHRKPYLWVLMLIGLIIGLLGGLPDSGGLLPIRLNSLVQAATPQNQGLVPDRQGLGIRTRSETIVQNPNFPPLPDLPPSRPTTPPSPDPPTAPLELPVPNTPAPSPRLPSANPADPADQIEPAMIEVGGRDRPMTPALAMIMQQELSNLIGRFESAMLMSASSNLPTEIALTSNISATKVNPEAPDTEVVAHPVLAEAQVLLNDWPELIARQDYVTTRDRWLAVRDALWDNFPTDHPYAQAEIRAVWLDRGTIVAARSPEGLAEVFDRLAAAGITTVFFETINASFPIYPSRVAPQQNPLTRGWDPLAAAVDLAHARGMTLHAWVWVFAAGNQAHNRLLNLPPDYLGPVLEVHPDWVNYDNNGNPIPPGQNKPFFDPANPEVRSYLTRLLSEIITEYDVDGLQLDYIRYPFQDPGANRTYGYGQAARWKFRRMTGVDPTSLSPHPDRNANPETIARQRLLWERWDDFRIQQVNSFVVTISQMVRRQRPDIVVSAAVFAKPEHERLQQIQQDWGTWARSGDVDWIVLMSYAEDTSRFEKLIQPWLVEEDLGAALVIPGIRLLHLSEAATIDQMQAARDLPTPGYALFATADLKPDLATVLAQTQGAEAIAASPIEQDPYLIAANRFHALQREWNWLLSHNQLWMEREQLTQWINNVNHLGRDLQKLAQTPSLRELDTVRTTLTAVQAPLTDQILVETVNGSYRRQSWHYRLATIEQLLAFGEKARQ